MVMDVNDKGNTLLCCLYHLREWEVVDKKTVDSVECQLFTTPQTLKYSLFSSFYFSLLTHCQTHTVFSFLLYIRSHLSSFYMIGSIHSVSLCPCIHLSLRPSLYVPLCPYALTPAVALSCSNNPYFCLYLQWRRCQGSVIGIQALSEPMQSPVSRIRGETSLSGFPR